MRRAASVPVAGGASTSAIADALGGAWDRDGIAAYAERNSWDRRVSTLAEEFATIATRHALTTAPEHAPPAKPSLLN